MSTASSLLVEEIRSAADQLDRPRVADLCTRLIGEVRRSGPYPVPQAKQVLQVLRRKRYFDLMQRVAEAFLQAGPDTPLIRRQYAQSLIDQGILTAAVSVLRELVAKHANPVEQAEAYGLIGRAFKQAYVDARMPGVEWAAAMLRQAVESYYAVYATDPAAHLWHGINTVACLKRAWRDGVAVPGAPDPDALAQDILAEIRDRGAEAAVWDLATALEAVVALGRVGEAARWTNAYAGHPGADAFELGSTLRQLTEVWELDATSELGAAVLPILRSALLQRENGFVELKPAEVRQSAAGLERVLGHDYFVSLEWYRNGLERARGVARIGLERERGLGTGFLLRGSDLCSRFGNELLLLTNAHVLSDEPSHDAAVRRHEAVVTFNAALAQGDSVPAYSVGEVLWCSAPDQLDVSVVRLDPPPRDVEPFPVQDEPPRSDGKQRLYIIGHPSGGTLSFSIHDNLLLDYDERLLHYRTPTEPGSSGSPIFNAQWKLVGIHHAGFDEVPRLKGQPGTYAANEGIRVKAVRQALADAGG